MSKPKVKNRFMVDSSNRLVVKRGKKRLVADGRFAVNKDNALSYWLNEPEGWRSRYSIAPKVSFVGKWRLDRNYDLELALDETKGQYKRDRLLLKGEIISADSDALVFQIDSLDKHGQSHIQILKLSGLWQADEFNRIVFRVAKKGSPDALLLSGIWQINQNQQIAYDYEKTILKTRDKISNTLTFRGFWEINSRNRLTYILSQGIRSRFDFRAQLESPNLYPKEGAIKYRIGIGLKGQRPYRDKIVTVYGAWKFSRKIGLTYEVDYGSGKAVSMEFGADMYFSKGNKIEFCLINRRKEPLGIRVIFTHQFLKNQDAQLFLKLKSSRLESGCEAGVRIPF